MISTKKRRQGSATVSSSDGYSRTLPRPSDIARNLATPTYPNSSSSTAMQRHQPMPSSSSSRTSHTPVSLGMASYGVGKCPMRAVANPYDDLSLYTSQINAVHKSDSRSGEQNHGNYGGRVSATSGGYFGYNKPVEASPGHYGYNKHSGSRDNDGRYGYNNKPVNSNDTRGYYGFNKPSKSDPINPSQYGYKKTNEVEQPKGYYGYNKPSISDSVFSGRYRYDKAPDEYRSGKPSRSKASAEPSSIAPQQMPSSAAYSSTLPWSGRYGKQGHNRDPYEEEMHQQNPLPPSSSTHLPHGLIYEGHTHCPGGNAPSQQQYELGENYNTSGFYVPTPNIASSSANYHQPYITSTPKHRREAPPPPVFEDHSFTSSSPSSSFSSPSSSSIDYTATLPAKLSRPGRSPQAPPNLHIRCDLASRFANEDSSEQQRSQSMSPRLYRSAQSAQGYPNTDLFVRETKTPPASNVLAYEDPAFNTLMGDMYDAQRQMQSQSSSRQQPKPKQSHGPDPRNQGAIPTPPKQAGLAATLNYHQQLRKELGMPQSSSPVPHLSSSVAAPFQFQQQQQHHLSDGNLPTTTTVASSNYISPEFTKQTQHSAALDRELGLLTTLAYDGNSRRFYDAFQNLHGHHNSTPHLPSASTATQPVFDDQPPLFGSDPNLVRKSRPQEFDTFYDNLFFSPPGNYKRPVNKTNANVTYPPGNPTPRPKPYPHDEETQRFLAQFETQPGSSYAQPAKSSESLPTSSSAFSSYHQPQSYTDFRDWRLDPSSTSKPSFLSSSENLPFPTQGNESYYSSTSVHGLCTLPRNNHSAFQHTGSGGTNKPISLAHKEPSYEEITNITPAPGKDTNSRTAQVLTRPDISDLHLDGQRIRNFPIPGNTHGFAPPDSSTNLSTSVAALNSSAISYPTIGSSGIDPSQRFGEQTVPSHHPGVNKLDKTYTGRIPTSDMGQAKIELNQTSSSSSHHSDYNEGRNHLSNQLRFANQDISGKPRSLSVKVKGERLPGSVSDRAHRFEQKVSSQGETKRKTGIPTFNFVKLRSKNAKTEKQEIPKPKEKSKTKREIRNLDSSFEKEEKVRSMDSSANEYDIDRDSFDYTPTHVENLVVGDRKIHDNIYELSPFPVASIPSNSSFMHTKTATAVGTTTATTSVPLLTFSPSKSSSPPRQRLSNPEDAVSKEAAFLAVTGSDVLAVAPARGQQTSSMHETGTGSVDVDSFNDFLLASGSSHNYHLFSRRKKPLPVSELDASPEYARIMSEVGRSPSGGADTAVVASAGGSGHAQSPQTIMTSSTNSSSAVPHTQSSLSPPAGGGGENNNEDDENFINKVCKFEMISRRKTSPTSSASSPSAATGKSPTTSVGRSPTSSKTFFASDGVGWRGSGVGGGRGSGGSVGSASGNSPRNTAQNPTIPLVSPFSPHGFVGEKVFTRDTATTRVSASLLQNLVSPTPGNITNAATNSASSGTGAKTGQVPQVQRVQSAESNSTPSTSSLTSVSSLSWASDRSDIVTGALDSSGQSTNRRGSGGASTGKRVKSGPGVTPPGSDIMTNSDPCVFPSSAAKKKEEEFGSSAGVPSMREEDIIYDDVPTPVPSPRVLPAHVTNRSEAAKHRGGVFDLPLQATPSEGTFIKQQNQNNSRSSSDSPRQGTPTRETPKRFVTLSTTDRDSYPAPVVKQLSPGTPTSFPYITSAPGAPLHASPAAHSPSPSSSSSEHAGPFTNGDVSTGSSSGHLPLHSVTFSSNRDSIRSGSSTGSGGHNKTSSSSSASSHRNTFEGMDFEFQELTSQQQQLALRHREVVAERKREQERERVDRQRLEDILKMCEEYQQEVESSRPTSSSSATASFSTNISTMTPSRSSQFPPNGPSHQAVLTHPRGKTAHHNARSDVSSKEPPPPPYSQIASSIPEQAPPPYSPKILHAGAPPQPPGQLNINTALTSSPTSSIDRKNKIKTNGSLMLGSPSSPYKEFATSFSYPSQVSATACTSTSTSSLTSNSTLTLTSTSTSRAAETSSAYSSNSEDEAIGSSEDTGTIKKRPGMGDGLGAIVGGNLSRQAYPQHQQNSNSSTNTPLASSYSPHNSSHSSRVQHYRDVATGWSSASTPSSAAGGGGSGSRNGAITMTADISDGNIVITTTKDFHDSAAASLSHHHRVSPKSYDLDHRRQVPRNAAWNPSFGGSTASSSSPTSTTTTTSTVTTTAATTKDQKGQLRHQSSTSSSSSSHTLRRSNCSSSGGSTQSLSEVNIVAMDTPAGTRKEDTPTPVNSDSEGVANEAPPLSPRILKGPELSPLLSVLAAVSSAGHPLSDKEECQFRGQLEGLKLTSTQLLVRTAEIRRQIAEIELLESEAVRELDLETKLLEGEHREQMAQLQQEQDKLSEMKRLQQDALDTALREREKEQRAINLERQKLIVLEEQQHAMHDRLLRVSSSSSAQDAPPGSPTSGPSSPTGSAGSAASASRQLELEELTVRRVRLQQELERQRRIFDDLEFQQLEAEARFESEREQLNTRLLAQQAELLQKYKEREERLQQIDIQQKCMVGSVKESLENYRQQRLDLIEAYRKEKAKIANCDKQIAELCRILSLPVPIQREDSDDDLQDPLEGYSELSPLPKQSQVFMDGDTTPTELRRPFDLSLDSRGTSAPPGSQDAEATTAPERKKSATLLEIERNRSLFIEQQVEECVQLGSMIIDQERRRIEELRRRAADEGRAQWEERRRAADESVRLQAEERQAREVNCKSFNSVESEDSSIASSCDTPSEKETR